MKKILLTLVLMLVTAVTWAHNFSAVNADGKTIYYSITNSETKTVSVTYQGSSYSSKTETYRGDVNIPSTVTCNGINYTVTGVGEYAFYSDNYVTSVSLPNTVTSIGSSAFTGCYPNVIYNYSNLPISHSGSTYGYANNAKYIYDILPMDTIGDYVWASKQDGETAILVKYNGSASSLKLPENYNGKSYDIAFGAFKSNKTLETVTISNNVINIDNSAFYNCSNLKSVIFGTRVASIANSAFFGCGKLFKTIFLSNTVPAMDGLNFVTGRRSYVANTNYPNTNLGKIKILDYLSSMFEVNGVRYVMVSPSERTCEAIDCSYSSNDAEINIGEFVTHKGVQLKVLEVNPYCLYDNDYVQSVDLSFKGNVGEYAFFNNSSLTTAKLTNEGYVDNNSFGSCENLKTATIANKGYIGNDAFRDCTNLQTASISNEGKIGTYAFSNCTNLENVEVTSDVTDISNYAFYKSFKETSDGIVKISNNGAIGNEAFRYCTGLKTATISNEGNIGNYAFSGCSGLEKVDIDSHVTNISDNAFYSSFTNASDGTATISNKGAIGTSAFANCAGLTHAIIYPTVTVIGTEAFKGSFTKNANSTVTATPTGAIGTSAFQNCTALVRADIGDKVTSIGTSAFEGCTVLQTVVNSMKITPTTIDISEQKTGVTLPTDIDTKAFKDCSSLTSVNIPEGLSALRDETFMNCRSLESLTLPISLQQVDNKVFANTGLVQIAIPSKTAIINNGVFGGCNKLKKVTFEDNNNPLTLGYQSYGNPGLGKGLFNECPIEEVYIGRNLTYRTTSNYGYSPFYANKALKKVTVGDLPTQIFENEFYECASLKDVSIGDGLTTIEKRAFSRCVSLESFSFGEGLRTIGEEAFSDCTAMISLYAESVTPPTCGNQALDDINKWECTLYVQPQSKEAYQAAEQWKEFFFIDGSLDAVSVESISINKTSLTLKVGENATLNAEVLPENASFKTVSWSSGDTNVARVDDNGEVTAIAAGTATITATTYNGIQSSCVVTVEPVIEIVPESDYSFAVTPKTYLSNSDNNISVSMNNIGTVYSFQCDVFLPEGVTIKTNSDEEYDVTLNSSRTTDNHFVSVALQADGAYRILCQCVPVTALQNNAGELFNIPITVNCSEGDYSLRIENILLVVPAEGDSMSKIFVSSVDSPFNVTSAINPTSISLDKESLQLVVGEKAVLTATVAPDDATDKTVNWSSTDNDVITVSGNGYVTSIGAGNATIEAKTVNGITAECDVKVIARGDANGDGRISLVDLSYVVSCIMNTPAYGVVEKAADVDGDGTTDVLDLTLLCQEILGAPSANTASNNQAKGTTLSTDDCLNTISIAKAEQNNIYIALDAAYNYVNSQFDLTLPKGTKLVAVTSDDELHKAMLNQINDNTWRVVIFSAQNKAFSNDNIMVLKVVSDGVQTNDIISFDNIRLVKVQNDAFMELNAPVKQYILGETTGIMSIDDNTVKDKYYNLSGQQVSRNHSGIYINRGNKTIYNK